MKCGMLTPNRMSDHVYKHLNAYLFCCPHCDLVSRIDSSKNVFYKMD